MEYADASIRAQVRMGYVLSLLLSGCLAPPSNNVEVDHAERDSWPELVSELTTPSTLPASTFADPFGAAYRGAVISRVVIERHNVFDERAQPAWLFGTANALHTVTRKRVITREIPAARR